jgi:hypothetical protein
MIHRESASCQGHSRGIQGHVKVTPSFLLFGPSAALSALHAASPVVGRGSGRLSDHRLLVMWRQFSASGVRAPMFHAGRRNSLRGLHSDDSQHVFRVRGEIPDTLGDVAELETPYEVNDEVPDAGHEVGAIAFSYLTAVLVEGDVPYPVKPVLDLPVGSVEGKDAVRSIFQACNAVNRFMTGFAAFDKKSSAFYPEDGPSIREIGVSIKFVTRPYLSRFDPSMGLV